MYDLVIKNGLLIDGTGTPGRAADIGIKDGHISQVGKLDDTGARVIDADGCAVAPGFIDIHSHTDELVLANPTCESKLAQGVTLEVSGNCGDSAVPRRDRPEGEGESWLAQYGVKPTWHTTAEFLSALEQVPLAINHLTLVGHGTVRAYVVGPDDRPATAAELSEMRRVVAQSMEEGAFGLSSGLIYPPGCYASTEEVIELARGVTPYGGFYATHMRNEGVRLLEAVDEAMRIGREAGIGVQISHHKGCGESSWGLVNQSLAMIDEARARGEDVYADQYPYVATCTGLGALLPKWVHDGGNKALMRRLTDPEERKHVREAVLRDTESGYTRDSGGWDSVVISSVKQDKNRFCEGLSITEIAEKLGKHPVDAALDLMEEEQGSVGMVHFVIDEDDVKTVMRHPAVAVGSDASARALTGPLSKGKPHPRAFGTFARVLGRYARDEKVIGLEEAVRKMTGLPASRLRLKNRGFVRDGYWADVTVFDPATVADMATFKEPYRLAAGIKYVVVNGVVCLEDGHITDAWRAGSGKIIRRGDE